jgi:Holliday junction resolvasome RuvABC DNA-binding subunit
LLAEGPAADFPNNGKRKIFEEAISALVNLGYTRSLAERTLSQVSLKEEEPLESVIRQALKILSEVRQ